LFEVRFTYLRLLVKAYLLPTEEDFARLSNLGLLAGFYLQRTRVPSQQISGSTSALSG
jgi:hypothetical protein